jgi:N-acetylmuramoyl-L-alanine amidase
MVTGQNSDAKFRLVIDPGHANVSTSGHLTPGVVFVDRYGNEICEYKESLACALTLKYVLAHTHPDVEVALTRETNDMTAPYTPARTSNMGECDIYLALHFDQIHGTSMAYYADDYRAHDESVFCKALEFEWKKKGDSFRIQPDSESNFKQLYIKDSLAKVAVLLELGQIQKTTATRRLDYASRIVHALDFYQKRNY